MSTGIIINNKIWIVQANYMLIKESDTFIFFPHPNLSIFKEVEDAHTRLSYLLKCPIYINISRFTLNSLNLEIKNLFLIWTYFKCNKEMTICLNAHVSNFLVKKIRFFWWVYILNLNEWRVAMSTANQITDISVPWWWCLATRYKIQVTLGTESTVL